MQLTYIYTTRRHHSFMRNSRFFDPIKQTFATIVLQSRICSFASRETVPTSFLLPHYHYDEVYDCTINRIAFLRSNHQSNDKKYRQ